MAIMCWIKGHEKHTITLLIEGNPVGWICDRCYKTVKFKDFEREYQIDGVKVK